MSTAIARPKTRRVSWPPKGAAKLSGKHFKAGGDDEIATINAMIRGALIARLDEMFLTGKFGALLGRDHASHEVRERARDLFQSMMLTLFPEEFCEPGEKYAPGVVPLAGPRRVGVDRLKRYGELTTGVTEE